MTPSLTWVSKKDTLALTPSPKSKEVAPKQDPKVVVEEKIWKSLSLHKGAA
jgi:hypothetical protein